MSDAVQQPELTDAEIEDVVDVTLFEVIEAIDRQVGLDVFLQLLFEHRPIALKLRILSAFERRRQLYKSKADSILL